MKKSHIARLALRSQTLRVLGHDALGRIAGGGADPINGFIMKDTIIVRTSGVVAGPTEGCR